MPRNMPVRKDPLTEYALPAVIKGTNRPVPLIATHFLVRVIGGLALVVTERTFRNAEAESIEATFTFPVPVHATLLGLKAAIGNRIVVGTAQRRTKARETYEAAIDSGKTAVLHEEVLRGVHMVSVAHVAPGSEIKVTATWGMPMGAAADSTATLRIPVTVGDIFGRSPLPESDDLTHSVHVHEATIEVSSADGSARLRGVALLDGRARVRLDAPIDIIVSDWSPRALRGTAADGRAVALGIVPAPEGRLWLDTAVLVDRSGSMTEAADGNRRDHTQTKLSKFDVVVAGLHAAAARVRDGDSIDLWEFDNTARRHSKHFAKAISHLMPPHRGGTATGDAVTKVLAGRPTRDVILITDGKSHALDVQAAARSGRRFHVVLIGEDSLEAHMGHLAALTGGQVFVATGEDSGEAIAKAFAAARETHIALPHIHGSPTSVETRTGGMAVRAAWGPAGADDAEIVGIVIPTMIEGAKADPVPAVIADGALIEAILDQEMSRAIAAVAAALAIPAMEENAAAAMAEAEGIVCHLTSLVLMDEAGEKQEGVPAQRKVATMTPRTHGMMAAAGGPAIRNPALALTGGTSVHMARLASPNLSAATREGSFLGDECLYSELSKSRTSDGATLGSPADIDSFLPPAHPAAPANANMSRAIGQIDWSAAPETLRQGDLSNLSTSIADAMLLASQTAAVQALATSLGITALAAVVAMLARKDSSTDRVAARVARSLLANADHALLAAAEKAIGL